MKPSAAQRKKQEEALESYKNRAAVPGDVYAFAKKLAESGEEIDPKNITDSWAVAAYRHDVTKLMEIANSAAVAVRNNPVGVACLFADTYTILGDVPRYRQAVETMWERAENKMEAATLNRYLVMLLMSGRWNEYRDLALPTFPAQTWLGGLANDLVLTTAQAGIGDVLFACRFLPFLKTKAKNVHLVLDPGHIKLLGDDFVQFLKRRGIRLRDELPQIYNPRFTCMGSFLQLAGLMPADVRAIPLPKWNVFNPAPKCSKLRVGLCHSALGVELLERRFTNHVNRLKSIDGIEFVSLQYGDPDCSIKSWEDTANILSGLDLLITVDTAVMHLAGALGIKTWACIHTGGFYGSWDGDDFPAYPTVEPFWTKGPTLDFAVDQIFEALRARVGYWY